MMKQSDQTQNVEATSTRPPQETHSMESSRTSPISLIFVAWLSGTLLFEISALDDLGSRSARQHAIAKTSALDTWTQRDARFSIDSPKHGQQSHVIAAGSVADTFAMPTMELSSYQVDLSANLFGRADVQKTNAHNEDGPSSIDQTDLSATADAR